MKVRYTLNADGEFADRDGNSIGRVTSLTIERDSSAIGGKGVAVEVSPSPSGKDEDEQGNQPPTPESAAIDEVWAHYVQTFASKAELNAQRRRDIIRALKVRSVEELCEAIDGLAKSPHHNGANETGTKYLDIRYALRGNGARGESHEERIDRMRQLAKAGPGASLPSRSSGLGTGNVWQGRIDDLKRVVRDGFAERGRPPAGTRDVERSEAAQATLAEEFGITTRIVETTRHDRWPQFEEKS